MDPFSGIVLHMRRKLQRDGPAFVVHKLAETIMIKRGVSYYVLMQFKAFIQCIS